MHGFGSQTLVWAWASCRRLTEARTGAPSPEFPIQQGLRQSLVICIPNKFPDAAEEAGPGTTL